MKYQKLVKSAGNIVMKQASACVISGQITITNDSSGNIRFLGEIENTGETKACFVKITFIMKDSSETILDIESCFVDSTHIDPG
ncbi:hypothetical protein ES702_04706 [subsurface metagenome]